MTKSLELVHELKERIKADKASVFVSHGSETFTLIEPFHPLEEDGWQLCIWIETNSKDEYRIISGLHSLSVYNEYTIFPLDFGLCLDWTFDKEAALNMLVKICSNAKESYNRHKIYLDALQKSKPNEMMYNLCIGMLFTGFYKGYGTVDENGRMCIYRELKVNVLKEIALQTKAGEATLLDIYSVVCNLSHTRPLATIHALCQILKTFSDLL